MSDNLDQIFTAVVFKSLVQVDLPKGSNQHEINGISALKAFFDTEQPISGTINWHYFSDNSEALQSTGNFKFYDSRARGSARTGRSEWRMYYSGDFLSNAQVGDVLVLARTPSGDTLGLVFQKNSGWLRVAQVLFQFENASPLLQLIPKSSLQKQEFEFAKRQILDELGIEISIPPSVADEEIAIEELDTAHKQGKLFPSTRRMSELAQSLVDVDFKDGDTALVSLIDREEKIFRAIEKIIVNHKLEQGFSSVDDFISYSLSVQNRRKSRMGLALQNHLSVIFSNNGLRYKAQAITEGKSKPDFLFPGEKEYRNPNFNANLLVMLAAKSSCKDRWRQILDEAERISRKHLCTLEQAISSDQTNAMQKRNVQLVIPDSLHKTYTRAQQKELWSINEFIRHIKSLQA